MTIIYYENKEALYPTRKKVIKIEINMEATKFLIETEEGYEAIPITNDVKIVE